MCTNSHKKRKGGGSSAPELCEVCLRPSAISADVTHAVGVADLAPAAEARLFAPFAVVVAVLAPEARLFAPVGQLPLTLTKFEFGLTLARCSSFMFAHGWSLGSGNESDSLACSSSSLPHP